MDTQFKTLVINFISQNVQILDVNDKVRLELILNVHNVKNIMSFIDNEDITDCYLDSGKTVQRITKTSLREIINNDSNKWYARLRRTYVYLRDSNPEKLNVIA